MQSYSYFALILVGFDSDKSSGVFDDLNTASNSTSDDDDMLDIVDRHIEDYFSEEDDEMTLKLPKDIVGKVLILSSSSVT